MAVEIALAREAATKDIKAFGSTSNQGANILNIHLGGQILITIFLKLGGNLMSKMHCSTY